MSLRQFQYEIDKLYSFSTAALLLQKLIKVNRKNTVSVFKLDLIINIQIDRVKGIGGSRAYFYYYLN